MSKGHDYIELAVAVEIARGNSERRAASHLVPGRIKDRTTPAERKAFRQQPPPHKLLVMVIALFFLFLQFDLPPTPYLPDGKTPRSEIA